MMVQWDFMANGDMNLMAKNGGDSIWFDDFPSYKPPSSLGSFNCYLWLPEGNNW